MNRVVTAAYTPATDYQITTQISRGQSVSIVVEYVASNLTPGYNLVADDLEFIRPGGSNAFVVTNIGEVTNGTHTEIHDALHILEIPTDQNTTLGSYTVRFKPRLGGTNNALAEQSVTFTVQ